MGPIHPGTLMVFGSMSTLTLTTDAVGAATTGIPARLPAVFVTPAETQQCRPALRGSTTYHQPPSPLLPAICALAPTVRALSWIQPVLGPRRQLTGCSLGKATGTVGVEVEVGGGVLEGIGVSVGVLVDGDRVAEGVISDKVGGAVGALEGRLQAERTKRNTNSDNKNFGLIHFSFKFVQS